MFNSPTEILFRWLAWKVSHTLSGETDSIPQLTFSGRRLHFRTQYKKDSLICKLNLKVMSPGTVPRTSVWRCSSVYVKDNFGEQNKMMFCTVLCFAGYVWFRDIEYIWCNLFSQLRFHSANFPEKLPGVRVVKRITEAFYKEYCHWRSKVWNDIIW